jgi:hypothetical protein
MPLQQLNRLANIYREVKTDESFQNIYDELREVRAINKSIVMRSGIGDEADALEIFHDVLWRVIGKDVEFGPVFHRSLKNERIDFFRDKKRDRDRISSIEEMTDWSAHGAPTPKALQSGYLEDEYFSSKKADQRQLIDSITRSVKTSTTMTSIIEAYETAPLNASPNAIAKTLGIHHETVSRKLRKLGRQFDMNRFGDIRDIIAV